MLCIICTFLPILIRFVALLSICVFHENWLKKGPTFLPGVSKIMFTVQLETTCFDNKTDLSKAQSLQFCTPDEHTRF
jgi:hypothetical protein